MNDAQPAPAGPLRADEIALLRASVELVGPLADDMTVYFYAILFQRHPETRELFPANLDVQRDRLLRGLLRIVDLVDDPENLVRFCGRLGRDHRKFGALNDHFPAVGAALLDSLARYAGDAWSPRLADIWARAYGVVSQVMIQAAEEDAAVRPAVWQARVIDHRMRAPGIAEITLLPDSPYPFVAGQYASVETPWQPRLWRHYSLSHAPRQDGTLTFHVRATRDGRVSSALVHQARPGDMLRLGAAQGEMVLDPRMERDVLCVAGGTGLAPIQALVEQAVRNGGRRFVDVFVGARTADELYGFEDLLRLAQRNHWLSVRAAVSDENIPGLNGSLPQVLRQFGPFYRHEAYVSGPVEMVSSAVRVLLNQGVPQARIHHDPFDVPVLEAALLPRQLRREAHA
ncbi:globin domain-containing protein [Streptacidiphilus jiangxiensis]|uniref:nitric oxide dioxygenase n=1 Tax=Streptacidiphilus jiangxiensis TaxID=235985 RepID=A0A1H7IC86_STRJI|nr:globin domain-containing protein [Streptacidiphilus jiangxiensis]SEK58225.1 NAD(P)H-flavin reductase [Streptacidiphilus jiangxiensis]